MDPKTPPIMAKTKTPPTTGAPADGATPYKNNADVDGRIDSYIRDNPKHWAYIQGLPRERLERTVVLGEVRQLERQQRAREGVLKSIERDPGLKQAYDTLVKDLPEDQRESVITQLERTKRRVASRTQEQTPGVRV